jgi:hypothetical protein
MYRLCIGWVWTHQDSVHGSVSHLLDLGANLVVGRVLNRFWEEFCKKNVIYT